MSIMGIEHLTSSDTRGKHKGTRRKGKEMGNHNSLTIIPRYSTVDVVKVHFFSLRWRSSLIMHCRTHLVHLVWVVESEE